MLKSNDSYLPVSVCFKAKLRYPNSLAEVEATVKANTEFEEVLLEYQSRLAGIIREQAERNLKYELYTIQEKIIAEMIKIGGCLADYQRKTFELFEGTVNSDALSKSAIINFIDAIGWLDEFQPFAPQKTLRLLFPQEPNKKKAEWINIFKKG